MLTEAQTLYLEDVLGISPRALTPPVPQIVVLVDKLSAEEGALLAKIMGSIGLSAFSIVDTPPTPRPQHLLSFCGLPGGRLEEAGGTRWELPSLASMLGSGAEVSQRKKEAWNTLQQMHRELVRP